MTPSTEAILSALALVGAAVAVSHLCAAAGVTPATRLNSEAILFLLIPALLALSMIRLATAS